MVDSGKNNDYVAKRLDLLIVILLTRFGLQIGDISKILGVSEKTVKRMLVGNYDKIKE